jgi:phage tail sheath gpL-like
MSEIQVVGLADNDPVPGTYIQINFGQGPASMGVTDYSVVLIGNKTASGSAVNDGYVYGPDTQIQMISESDVIQLFGPGSELHRMWRRFTAVNTASTLYAIAVTEASGAAATGTVVVTGTATSSGSVRVLLSATEFVEVGVASGDTPTIIGAGIQDAVNGNINLPFTAVNTAGSVVMTAKNKGLRGNFIRFSAQVLPLAGVGITVTPTGRTLFSGGATQDSNTAALNTLKSKRYYYNVSAANDATQLGNLSAQIDSNSGPLVGLTERGIYGSVDTLGATTTVSTGLNQARMECEWYAGLDWTPAEFAANNCAVYSLFETTLGGDFSMNFDGFGGTAQTQPFWKVPAPLSGVAPTRPEQKAALNAGITPVGSSRPGSTYLIKRITTRSLTNAQPDYRTRDAHKVTVADRYADDLRNKIALQFSGKQIGNDPADGQLPPSASTVTPKIFKATVDALTNFYGNKGLLQEVQSILANTQVVREVSPSTRMGARIPLNVIDICDQFAIVINVA